MTCSKATSKVTCSRRGMVQESHDPSLISLQRGEYTFSSTLDTIDLKKMTECSFSPLNFTLLVYYTPHLLNLPIAHLNFYFVSVSLIIQSRMLLFTPKLYHFWSISP